MCCMALVIVRVPSRRRILSAGFSHDGSRSHCAWWGICTLDRRVGNELNGQMDDAPKASPASSSIGPWLEVSSPLLIIPLVECLVVGPVGAAFFASLPGLLVGPALVALVYVFLGPLLLIPKLHRRRTLRRLGLCAVLILSTFAGLHLRGMIRTLAFNRLAERSKGLVGAIQRYESAKGAPPPSLAALVPEFLEAVPGTGMAAYPEYRYAPRGGGSSGTTPPEQNPWMLWVNTPSGGINFDEFMYFPLQNYPEKDYGGVLQRIGEWAYLHE